MKWKTVEGGISCLLNNGNRSISHSPRRSSCARESKNNVIDVSEYAAGMAMITGASILARDDTKNCQCWMARHAFEVSQILEYLWRFTFL